MKNRKRIEIPGGLPFTREEFISIARRLEMMKVLKNENGLVYEQLSYEELSDLVREAVTKKKSGGVKDAKAN